MKNDSKRQVSNPLLHSQPRDFKAICLFSFISFLSPIITGITYELGDLIKQNKINKQAMIQRNPQGIFVLLSVFLIQFVSFNEHCFTCNTNWNLINKEIYQSIDPTTAFWVTTFIYTTFKKFVLLISFNRVIYLSKDFYWLINI